MGHECVSPENCSDSPRLAAQKQTRTKDKFHFLNHIHYLAITLSVLFIVVQLLTYFILWELKESLLYLLPHYASLRPRSYWLAICYKMIASEISKTDGIKYCATTVLSECSPQFIISCTVEAENRSRQMPQVNPGSWKVPSNAAGTSTLRDAVIECPGLF